MGSPKGHVAELVNGNVWRCYSNQHVALKVVVRRHQHRGRPTYAYKSTVWPREHQSLPKTKEPFRHYDDRVCFKAALQRFTVIGEAIADCTAVYLRVGNLDAQTGNNDQQIHIADCCMKIMMSCTHCDLLG